MNLKKLIEEKETEIAALDDIACVDGNKPAVMGDIRLYILKRAKLERQIELLKAQQELEEA